MKKEDLGALFLILEPDPVVRMDIQEMLLRQFGGWTVVVVAGLKDLPHAVRVTKGPRIVIASDTAGSFSEAAASIDPDGLITAILLTDEVNPPVDSAIPYLVIQKPFNSAQLLNAVTNALESLPSSR